MVGISQFEDRMKICCFYEKKHWRKGRKRGRKQEKLMGNKFNYELILAIFMSSRIIIYLKLSQIVLYIM